MHFVALFLEVSKVNVFESIAPVYSEDFVSTVLAAYGTNPAAALVPSPEMHLIQSPGGSFTPDSLPADFAAVEADYDDYAALALTAMTIANLGGNVRGVTGSATFNVTTDPPVVVNTIFGYWIETAGGVVAYELFPVGERTPMAVAGDKLIIVYKLPLTPFISVPVQQ